MSSTAPSEEAFREVLDQHRALRELLGRIGTLLQERTASIDEVADSLGQLGDMLIKHFTREESGGYYSDVVLHAPQLLRRANDLLAQHPKMTQQAQHLIGIAPSSTSVANWWDETRTRFDAFVRELLDHERGEDRLIQEAYGRDVEAGD